ncbi:MAG: ABC transporter ATP-binding protein, partial [Erysipelotrichaceae bacterium]|nr:ABC transporter ATP-binding protein [Erysipelotrichaceae bacterium]
MTVKLKYEDLTVTYRDRVNGDNTVVDGLNLEVEEGQILGIVGPSGCGKTTLVRALCGFINPDKGNIYVNGNLVFSKEKKINVAPEKRNIGVVFQDYAVWPHLSVYDNIAYPLKKRKVPKDEIPGKVAGVLEQVRMSNYANYMPAQLSGGQQQRVAIARALVSSDDIIVLDEPITNLDAKLREEMIVEIQLIQRRLGTTIIYITHDQEAALQLCDKVAIMQPDGKICQIGTDEQIIT